MVNMIGSAATNAQDDPWLYFWTWSNHPHHPRTPKDIVWTF
jgi:hypothetical protein